MRENSNKIHQSKTWYNLILHLHPRKIRPETLRFTLTFGLGGMAALLIVIQVFTGLLLKFHYIPSPSNAYNSVQFINEGLPFGKLAHNLHHWSAILLLWITFLHMLRVFFTGAYRKPRQVTWIFGIVLLILVVLSNFTGYLLPWDQLSYWAVTVSTSLLQYIPFIGSYFKDILLGGQEVGSATLSNFFNLHTGIIPLVILILNLALLENSQGNLVSSEEYFLKALKKEPDNYDFIFAITTFYLEHNEKGKALSYARQLDKKYPGRFAGKQLIDAAMQ